MSLIFVDVEASGGCPATGRMREFGAVSYPSGETFHGVLNEPMEAVFRRFDDWLTMVSRGRPVFVSDNVAFDWQWINDGFWRTLGRNPFGHSGRRIGDFYAGLVGDFHRTQSWKRWRRTPHDHHPVHDAMGNCEAFAQMCALADAIIREGQWPRLTRDPSSSSA